MLQRRRRLSLRWLSRPSQGLGGLRRELGCGAAALGVVASLGWASEGEVCEHIGAELEPERAAELERYVVERCDDGACESAELVGTAGCRAKIRVVERRFDAYGEAIGLFRVDEGLEFSPLLDRWRRREQLETKQLLGY